MQQDLRHSLRLLARSPGFTLTAVLVLALGIGTNTAVFTATNVLLFKPLGGPAPGELAGVYLRDARPGGGYRPFSYPDYRDLVAASRPGSAAGAAGPFASLMAQQMVTVGVTEGPVTRKAFACLVSSGYFEALGVSIPEGRAFLAHEDESSAQPAVIVSRAYRDRKGEQTALGRSIVINNRAFTIVGVAPEGFSGTTALASPEMWIPIGASALLGTTGGTNAASLLNDRSQRTLMVVGRLRPGLSREAAMPLLAPVASRLRKAAPVENGELELSVGAMSRLSLGAGPRDDSEVAAVLFFLTGMAAVVLLIACLNLANMLMARGGARSREIAVRLALGGSRFRVARQLLTESMLLSGGGALLGLLLSVAGTRLLARALAAIMPLPIVFETTPDARVLAATITVSALSTIAFGLGPAVRMSRSAALPSLKGQAGQMPAGPHGLGAKNLLVVGQLALCLVLLSAAGLFVRGTLAAGNADPGFPLERGLIASTDASLAGYEEARGRDAYRRLITALRGIPGVEAASFASSVPFGIDGSSRRVRRPDAGTAAESWSFTVVVGSDYFRAVGLPVLRGRDFTEAEERGNAGVRAVIVDLPMAKRLWPEEDPLGRRLQLETDSPEGGWKEPAEVVGVVAGVRDSLFDKEPGAHVYLPSGREYRSAMHLHVKLRAGEGEASEAMAAAIRRELAAADAAMPILSIKTLREHRDTSLYVWIARASACVFATFGLSALLLALLGVYGVKAYLVSRRTREVGIRVALGASRMHVLGLVLSDGMWLTTVGLGVGLALSVALSKVLASWVYGVSGIDPIVIAGAGMFLAAAALLACYLPARRAMKMAPSAALRAE